LWAGGGSLDIQIVCQSDDHLDFNVTRCQYAEFYQQMGLADLGYRVHCNRDHAPSSTASRRIVKSTSSHVASSPSLSLKVSMNGISTRPSILRRCKWLIATSWELDMMRLR
jgi:hypothetical protein